MQKRVALITGAGRGIGRAIALGLAKTGARMALAARSRAELDDVAGRIASAGGESLVVPADLAEHYAAARLVDQVRARLGPVEILVNNAGVGSSQDPRPLVEFDDRFWDLTFAINVAALAVFLAGDEAGAINGQAIRVCGGRLMA